MLEIVHIMVPLENINKYSIHFFMALLVDSVAIYYYDKIELKATKGRGSVI